MPTPYINETKSYLLHPIRSPFKGFLYLVIGVLAGFSSFFDTQEDGVFLSIVNVIWIVVAIHFTLKGLFFINNRKKQAVLLEQTMLYYTPMIDPDEEDLKPFELKEIAIQTIDLCSVTSFFKQKIQTQNQTTIEELVLKINQEEHVFASTEFLSPQDWQSFQSLLERKISYGIWEISPVLLTMVTHESKANQNYINLPKTLHLYLIAFLLTCHLFLKQQGLIPFEEVQYHLDGNNDLFEFLKQLPILQNLLILKDFGALFPTLEPISKPFSIFTTVFLTNSLFQLSLHGYMIFKFVPILEFQIGKIKALNLMLISSAFAYATSLLFANADLTFGPATLWVSAMGAVFFKNRYQRTSIQDHQRLSLELIRKFEFDFKNTLLFLFIFVSQLSFPFLSFDLTKYIAAFVFGILYLLFFTNEKSKQLNVFFLFCISALSLWSCLQLNPIQKILKENLGLSSSQTAQQQSNPQPHQLMISQLLQTKGVVETTLLAKSCLEINCGVENEKRLIDHLEDLRMYDPFNREIILFQTEFLVKNQNIQEAKKRYFQLLDADFKKDASLPLDQRPISKNIEASYLSRIWHQLALQDQIDQTSPTTQILLPNIKDQISIKKVDDTQANFVLEILPITKPQTLKNQIQAFNLKFTFEQGNQEKITDYIQIYNLAFNQTYQIPIHAMSKNKNPKDSEDPKAPQLPKNLTIRDISFALPTNVPANAIQIKHYQIQADILLIPYDSNPTH
jgi:membrane associated rhomboid family serine protease